MFNRHSSFNRLKFNKTGSIVDKNVTIHYSTRNRVGLVKRIKYPVSTTANVLNAKTTVNTANYVGIKKNLIYPTENHVSVEGRIRYSTKVSVMILKDKPSHIKGVYGNALRLGKAGLKLSTGLLDSYTIRMKRRAESKFTWDELAIRSDGNVYVNGVLNNSYDTTWASVDINGDLTLSSSAWDIDELMVIPKIVTEAEIKNWYNKKLYYYSDENIQNIQTPSSVGIQTL